jgi:hypothetical protein
MAEPAKIPRKYVRLVAGMLDVGEKMHVDYKSMRVDHRLLCWIDPFAKPENPKAGGNLLVVKRVEGGVSVDLSKCEKVHFEIGPSPEPKHGLEWLPVVAFTGIPPEKLLPG